MGRCDFLDVKRVMFIINVWADLNFPALSIELGAYMYMLYFC